MVLFVASNPSKLNKDPSVAMVGSKSEKTFNAWVELLIKDEEYLVINVSNKVTENNKPLKKSDYDLERLASTISQLATMRVIALGNTASDALDRIGAVYFKLPHPSPLNRSLNDSERTRAILKACKVWLSSI